MNGRWFRFRAALSAFLVLCGCTSAHAVKRVYGDQVVDGRLIEGDAYAAFLTGVIAEASGQSAEALSAYAAAARGDPNGSEVWNRIATLRCAAASSDRRADEALARSLAIDPGDARTWAASARCAAARGNALAASAAAARAAQLDPSGHGAVSFFAGGAPGKAVRDATAATSRATRVAMVASALTADDPAIAWQGLASWSEAHGDVALVSLAFQRLVRVAPDRRDDAARAAERLALRGQMGEARVVAAVAMNADERPLAGPRFALAARLAVDDAVSRGDVAAVCAHATRGRVSLEEAAARALLAGDAAMARELSWRVARADPEAVGAKLVFAAAEGRDVLGASRVALTASRGMPPVSAATWVVFGQALPPDTARATLALIAHETVTAGDTLVARSWPTWPSLPSAAPGAP